MTDCLLWKYSARAGARAAVCCRGRAARTACGAGAGEGRCQRCRDPPISQTARKRSAPRRAGLRRGRAPGRCSFLLPVLSIYVGTGAGNVRVLGGWRWRRRMWQARPHYPAVHGRRVGRPQARIPPADAIRGLGTRIWAAAQPSRSPPLPHLTLHPPHLSPSAMPALAAQQCSQGLCGRPRAPRTRLQARAAVQAPPALAAKRGAAPQLPARQQRSGSSSSSSSTQQQAQQQSGGVVQRLQVGGVGAALVGWHAALLGSHVLVLPPCVRILACATTAPCPP